MFWADVDTGAKMAIVNKGRAIIAIYIYIYMQQKSYPEPIVGIITFPFK
jgi:hypothetical protein